MTSGWIFGETGSAAITATIVAAVLLMVFVGALWRRRRRGRLAATVIAVVSLLFLFLRPGRLVEAGAASAVLLTEGGAATASDEDDDLRFAVAPAEAEGWRSIPDLGFLLRRHPEVDRLRVLGHGLSAWEWEKFAGEVEMDDDTPFTPGVLRIAWPRRLVLGEDLVVRGVASGATAPGGGTLRLTGPGGTEDSVVLAGADEEPFELRARPRDAGRLLYHWQLEDSEGTIDVVVSEPSPLAVLWLEDAPGFETRHFKRWLADRGGRLAVRTKISRGRYRTEFHDHPSVGLGRLEPALLPSFDLVVVDSATLAALRAEEAEALRTALSESGLGMLIRTGPGKDELPDGWPPLAVEPVAKLDEMSVAVSWPGAEPATPLVIAARQIVLGSGLDPLAFDGAGRVLAARRFLGAGAVGMTLVDGSYRWVLEGNAEHHGRYWSRLLGALAKPDDAPRWRLPAGPILVDRPLELILETKEPSPAASVAAGDDSEERLALRQDVLEPRRWRTLFWPRQTGWHRLTVTAGEEAWLFAEEANRWTAWQQAQRREATRQRAVLGGQPAAGGPTARRAEELPRWWFYGTFLLSVGYLWIVERWRLGG